LHNYILRYSRWIPSSFVTLKIRQWRQRHHICCRSSEGKSVAITRTRAPMQRSRPSHYGYYLWIILETMSRLDRRYPRRSEDEIAVCCAHICRAAVHCGVLGAVIFTHDDANRTRDHLSTWTRGPTWKDGGVRYTVFTLNK